MTKNNSVFTLKNKNTDHRHFRAQERPAARRAGVAARLRAEQLAARAGHRPHGRRHLLQDAEVQERHEHHVR